MNAGGPAGEVWATETTVGGVCYGTVLSVELSEPYDAPLSGLGLKCPVGPGMSYTAYVLLALCFDVRTCHTHTHTPLHHTHTHTHTHIHTHTKHAHTN